MTLAAVRALLKDSIDFFVQLDEYLERRSNGMIRGAQGESRYVSLWTGIIGQENGQRELSKLQAALDNLPEEDKFDQLSKAEQIKLEHQYKTLIAKTTNRLKRAQELLEELKFNSIRSLQFIPVPAHKKLGEDLDQTLAHCNSVLEKHNPIIIKAITRANKSWLTQELHLFGAMVAARASSIGLSNSTQPYRSVEVSQATAAENYKAALIYFKEIAAKIASVPSKTMQPTSTTRKILELKRPEQIPGVHSVHWQYCPRGIAGKMDALKSLIESKDNALKPEEVHQMIQMEFPQPRSPYKPWKS